MALSQENTTSLPATPSRTRRAGLAAMAGLMRVGTAGILGLMVTPYVQGKLGTNTYGVWLILTQMMSYLNTVDLFPNSLLKYELASLKSSTDCEEKKVLIGYGVWSACLSVPIFLIGILLAWKNAQALVNNESGVQSILPWVVILLGFSIIQEKWISVPEFALVGENLDYKSTLIRVVALVGIGILDVSGVAVGLGLVGLALSRWIGSVVQLLVLGSIAFKNISWFTLIRPKFFGYWQFWRRGIWLFVQQIANTLTDSIDIVLIGYLCSPSAAAVYVLTGALARLGGQACSMCLNGLCPGFGDLVGQGQLVRAEVVRRESELVLILLWCGIGSVVLSANQLFVGLWVGSNRFGGETMTALVLALGLLKQFTDLQTNLLLFGMDIVKTSWVKCLTAIIGAIGAIGFGYAMGANGCLLGLIMGRLVFWVFGAVRLNDLLKVHNGKYWLWAMRPLSVSVMVTYLVGRLFHQLNGNGWAGFFLIASGAGIIGIPVVWVLGLNRAQRGNFILRIKIFTDRKRKPSQG